MEFYEYSEETHFCEGAWTGVPSHVYHELDLIGSSSVKEAARLGPAWKTLSTTSHDSAAMTMGRLVDSLLTGEGGDVLSDMVEVPDGESLATREGKELVQDRRAGLFVRDNPQWVGVLEHVSSYGWHSVGGIQRWMEGSPEFAAILKGRRQPFRDAATRLALAAFAGEAIPEEKAVPTETAKKIADEVSQAHLLGIDEAAIAELQEAIAACKDRYPAIKSSEISTAKKLAEAARNHPLLEGGGFIPQPTFLSGDTKCRPDLFNPLTGAAVDLKYTSRGMTVAELRRTCAQFGYVLQAEHFRRVMGDACKHVFFLFVGMVADTAIATAVRIDGEGHSAEYDRALNWVNYPSQNVHGEGSPFGEASTISVEVSYGSL